MPTLTEGNLTFDFPTAWHADKYDAWSFYRNQFNSCCSSKAIDFLAFDPASRVLWLIEVKDYRRFRRQKDKTISLPGEIGLKVRDSLAGIFAARVNAVNQEQAFARRTARATRVRVVLHLEQPHKPSKLFPRAYDPANVQEKLKQIVKPIDPHPVVVEISTTNRIPWHVRSIP